MSVVERIEKYTAPREREKLDKGDSPDMNHLGDIGANVTLCGAAVPFSWGRLPLQGREKLLDCVVCAEIAKARGWL